MDQPTHHREPSVVCESINDDDEGPAEQLVTFNVKWRSQVLPITLPLSSTLLDLKLLLDAETTCPYDKLKLLGLVKGAIPPDTTPVSQFSDGLEGRTVTMMGTPAEAHLVAPQDMEDLPEVLNDLDFDYSRSKAAVNIKFLPENQIKLQKRIKSAEILIMTQPRPGSKLLVLDLDYTLWDHKSPLSPVESKRPFADEMMSAAYAAGYDIVMWSQTARWAIDAKITEMGFIFNPNYKISFVLDRTCMFTVTSRHKGKERTHEVKALDIIWARQPQWSSKNTIHIDDLSRNFALNPKSGLKIEAYRDCHAGRRDTDRELELLTRYLVKIKDVQDFDTLDHSVWKEGL
jgi:ubiquitin-like domain-containing CTD phosphatase 1